MGADADSSCTESCTDSWSPDGARNPWSAPTTELWAPTRALRVFPESDQRFHDIFGLREDSESANSDYKSKLWNKRCRTLRHESVEFNNIGYQIYVLITALIAYHNRTGADMSQWFGLHEMPTKEKRRLALAA